MTLSALHPDIGAAERFVLWRGTQDADEAFKIALMSLITRGFLRRERDGDGFSIRAHRPIDMTVTAADHAIVTIVTDGRRSRMEDIVRAAMSRYGGRMKRFVWDLIVPDLVARGLATVEQRQILWIIPGRRTLRPTADGARLAATIEHDVQRARAIPALLREDRAKALAIAVAVGAVTFLMLPELREVHADIAGALEARRADGGGGSGDSSDGGTAIFGSGGDGTWPREEEWDINALASIDSAFQSAVSSAGGGGDADGGGGDGGGGGGD